MLTKTAIRILQHEKRKYLGVIIGVAMAVFLVLLQSAFYFGFRRDITVVADSFDADLWISQREFLAFDYVAQFDDLLRWQALGDADIAAAMPVIVEWSRIRRLATSRARGSRVSARRVCAPHGPKYTVGMPSGAVHEPFGSVHESSLRAHEPSGAAHGRVWPAHEAAGRAHGWVGSPHGWPEAAQG